MQAITVNLSVDGPNATRAGTKDDHFTSGGFRLHIRPTGEPGEEINFTYEHRWVVGGTPVYPDGVEEWRGREGHDPHFTAAPKIDLSRLILTAICWYGTNQDQGKPDSQTIASSRSFWVMPFEDEPVPTWNILCDGDMKLVPVVLHELNWLKEGHHVTYIHADGKLHYAGTSTQFKILVSTIPVENGNGNGNGDENGNGNGDGEPPPTHTHKRTVDLRMVEGYVTDCGVKVTATEDGITKGKITIYSSAEPISEEGHIEKVVQFSIGKGSALVKMCRANWGVEEADTAIIVADKKFSASAVWLPPKEGEDYEYVGVPGIEPL